MEFSNKKVLVTGGSAGIGEAFVSELLARGVSRIAILGRRQAMLESVKQKHAGVEFLLIQGDMGIPADVKRAADQIKAAWGGLDILINNAGVVSAGHLDELSDEDIIQMININLTGLVLLTKHLLPLLKQSSEACLMNISSGLGYIAQPFYNVYAATKAAVKQLSDSLRRELFRYPIHVMTVFPTTTDTPMMVNAKVAKVMDRPEEVARVSVEGMIAKQREVVFGGEQRVADIQLNFEDPEAMDQKSQAGWDAMRERTANHRAM